MDADLPDRDRTRVTTLVELIVRAGRVFRERTALVCGERALSFGEVEALSARVANALARRGVRPGDRVTLYAPNSPEWVATYYGILRLGAVVNPVNAMITPDELRYALTDCGAVALFATSDKLAPLVTDPTVTSLRAVVALDVPAPAAGVLSFAELVDGESAVHAPVSVQPDATSTICYTSGTTGRPKGAVHTHHGVVVNTAMTALMHGRTAVDICVSALPCPHVYGNVVLNGTFLTGMTLVLHARFDEYAVLDSIRRHRATMFEGVPAMYLLMLNHPALEDADLTSLRLCTVGGQTMPEPKMRQVESRFGCPLIELWGMTEIAGLGTTFPHYGPTQHGSIGVPMPGYEVRIVATDDPNQALGVDEPGELMVRGPSVMQGYFGNEDATRATLRTDGWLHTGDIARRDSRGFLYVVDRKKDMILTAGYNVYPAEIERVLAEHPGIALAAVGAISDEIKGELPKAYVVPRTGATLEADEVLAFCRQRLAAYKVPRAVAFVADLPRTSSGKVMRRRLAELD
jgi:long-chain acyl-CoA synthetase